MAYSLDELNTMEKNAKKRLSSWSLSQDLYNKAMDRINKLKTEINSTPSSWSSTGSVNTWTPKKINNEEDKEQYTSWNKDLITWSWDWKPKTGTITNPNLPSSWTSTWSTSKKDYWYWWSDNVWIPWVNTDTWYWWSDNVWIPWVNIPSDWWSNNNSWSKPSDTFNKISSQIESLNSFSWWKDRLIDIMSKSKGSVDEYVSSFYSDIDKKLSKWDISSSEASKLKKDFKWFLDKMWVSSTISIEDDWEKKNLGSISYATWVDSEWKTIYSSINLDSIAEKVWSQVFSNKTFKNNFDKYIKSLEDQIQTQRDILEWKNNELQKLYTNQSSQFQNRFWTLFNQIQEQENEMKTRFWDIEKTTVDYFNELEKTIWSREAAEKSWLASDVKSKWLSDAFVANSLTSLDNKYSQQRLNSKDAYNTAMINLANNYDNMYQTLISNTSNLTQSELDFSNMVLNRQKELIEWISKFEDESSKALYQPLNEVLKAKMEESVWAETKIEWKKAQNEMYSSSDQSTRLKIIYDYMWMLSQNGIDVDKLKESDIIEAAKRDDLSLALTYLWEAAWWDAESISNIANSISSWSSSNTFWETTLPWDNQNNNTEDTTGDTTEDNTEDTTEETTDDTTEENNTWNQWENNNNDIEIPSYLNEVSWFVKSLMPKEREIFINRAESLYNVFNNIKPWDSNIEAWRKFSDFADYVYNSRTTWMSWNWQKLLTSLEIWSEDALERLADEIVKETKLNKDEAREYLDNQIWVWWTSNFFKWARIAKIKQLVQSKDSLIDNIWENYTN